MANPWKVYKSRIPECKIVLPCGMVIPFQNSKFATNVLAVQDKLAAYVPESNDAIYIDEADHEYDVENPLDINDFAKRKDLLDKLAALGGTVVFDNEEGAAKARSLGVTTSKTMSAVGMSADSNSAAGTGGVKVNVAKAG